MRPAGASLSDWLRWLETLSPTEINLGLERINDVLMRLSIPRPEQVLLVAGTNGKGSSVAMASALLKSGGYRVGAYTSPHIQNYNERIVVDGEQASDDDIVAAFEAIEAVREDIDLTYFEYGTLAALLVFAAAELDVWVLEVGLGGRLDATNAIDPTASLITNIALDHCDWLGDTVEAIGAEKAGIMRDGVATVFGDAEVPASVVETAAQIGADLRLASRDYQTDVHSDGSWRWSRPGRVLDDLHPPGLLGEFQIHNAAAVVALLDAAGLDAAIDRDNINAALPAISLTGRAQSRLIDGEHWLFDVAHNPAAAEKLAETLGHLRNDGEVVAIVGVLEDKDLDGLVMALQPHVDRWIAMQADNPRAIAADELGRRIANTTNKPCQIANSAEDATKMARQGLKENDKILVSGSFFAVGPISKQLTLE